MTRNEKRLRGIRETQQKKAQAIQEFWDREAKEDRDLTEDERTEVVQLVKGLDELKIEQKEVEANIEVEQEVKKASEALGPAETSFTDFGRDVQTPSPAPEQIKSLGDQFIEAKGYKELIESGLKGQDWSTGQIELETKGTLSSTPGSVLTPTSYLPGIVETLYQRLYVADLMGSAVTNASNIAYVEETTATNAAAAVAERGTKPESTLVFTERQEPVRKIATILPVTDEMLEDAPQIAAYINQRLTLFVKQTEEAQLLLGSGSGANIRGLVGTTRAIGTYARGTVDDNALALFKAMNGTRGSAFLDPDAIVIHPTNWQAIRTAKDSSGQYYGGGPFYGPYGGPQGPAGASQFSADSIWGTRVVVTSAITVGTALVGAFSTASAVHRRSGVTVEATNSHSTWFADNITALRAEERLGLAVYRPTAFTAVTGLS